MDHVEYYMNYLFQRALKEVGDHYLRKESSAKPATAKIQTDEMSLEQFVLSLLLAGEWN